MLTLLWLLSMASEMDRIGAVVASFWVGRVMSRDFRLRSGIDRSALLDDSSGSKYILAIHSAFSESDSGALNDSVTVESRE